MNSHTAVRRLPNKFVRISNLTESCTSAGQPSTVSENVIGGERGGEDLFITTCDYFNINNVSMKK